MGRKRVWLAAGAIAGLLTLGLAPPATAALKPNLKVTKVSEPPAGPIESTTSPFGVVSATTKNAGKRRSAASSTAFYLSTDTSFNEADDPAVVGSDGQPLVFNVPRLKPGASKASGDLYGFPAVGTPSGTYYLLACADDGAVVLEKVETDNCRASTGQMVYDGTFKIQSVQSLGNTDVRVRFNHQVDHATLQFDSDTQRYTGIEFTFDNGLTTGGSGPPPFFIDQIDLVTSGQSSVLYTMTVATTVEDAAGQAIAPPNNTATFQGTG